MFAASGYGHQLKELVKNPGKLVQKGCFISLAMGFLFPQVQLLAGQAQQVGNTGNA